MNAATTICLMACVFIAPTLHPTAGRLAALVFAIGFLFELIKGLAA